MSENMDLPSRSVAPSAGAAVSRRRWDLLAFAAVLLGPVLIAGGALAVRQDTGRLEDELLRDAEAALTAPHARPVHVDTPASGAFGDALALHLPSIEAMSRETEADREALRAVAAGKADEASLSPTLRAALVRVGPALGGLLAGTHAARADLPQARESYVPADGTSWAGLQFSAVLAAVQVRHDLASNRAGDAAATCLDGLALGRDAGISGGLVGRMTGTAITSRLVPACQAAFTATAPSADRAMLARLRVLRDSVPSYSEMLRVEFLSSDLFIHAPLLDEAARSRLGRRAKAILKDGDRSTSLWERVVLRHSWHATHRHRENLVEAAASPPSMREAAIVEAEKKAAHWMNPVVHLEPSYLRYVRRAEAATRRLDALGFVLAARAFRAEHGKWPEDCRALLAAGLATSEEVERSGSARFDQIGSGGLRITVPLPQADPAKDEDEVVLSLDGT